MSLRLVTTEPGDQPDTSTDDMWAVLLANRETLDRIAARHQPRPALRLVVTDATLRP